MDSEIGDVAAHILNSKYRHHILEHLATHGRATPKEIATATDDPRPHVSRALAELREAGVVELQVSEATTVGRYYALTELGRSVWPDVRAQLRTFEWAVTGPTSPETRAVVDLCTEAFGPALRLLCLYDGSTLSVLHAKEEVFDDYTDAEFEDGARTLIFDHALGDFEVAGEQCWSEVTHFDDFTLLRIRVTEAVTIAITIDRDETVLTPAFPERVADTYRENVD